MNNLSIFFLFSYTDLRLSLKNNLLFKTAIFKYVLVNLKRSQNNPFTVGGKQNLFCFFPHNGPHTLSLHIGSLETWHLGNLAPAMIPMGNLKTGL